MVNDTKLEEENNLLGKELRENTLDFTGYIYISSKVLNTALTSTS